MSFPAGKPLLLMNIRRFLQFIAIALLACTFTPVRAADEKEAIIQATMRYVFQNAGVNDPSVTVEEVAKGFARVKVKSISGATDPATAFLKGSGESWTVLFLGTGITAADLARLGVPPAMAK